MGWNEGYLILEKAVIDAHNSDVLDKKRLEELVEPFKGRDVDSGDSEFPLSKDGLTFQEIVVKVMSPRRYAAAQKLSKSSIDGDESPYDERISDLWHDITSKKWDFY